MLNKLEGSIVEVVMAYVKRTNEHLIVSAWDIRMSNSWKNLSSPSYTFITSGPNVKTDRSKIKWIPPEKGIFKINFDGCSRGNPGESGIGVCIRDYEGKIIELLAKKIPPGTNNTAEALALLFGLRLALDMNLKDIHIEGDSNLVINSCLKRNVDNWKFGYILVQVWNILDKFNSVVLSHTLREGNRVADSLSNVGCDLQSINKEVRTFDAFLFPNLYAEIEKDCSGHS